MALTSSARGLFQAPFQTPSEGQACVGNPCTAACGGPACLQKPVSDEVDKGGPAHAYMVHTHAYAY